MTDAIDVLNALWKEEPSTDYKRREAERRKLFFKAIGKSDDGRFNPVLTREEFKNFCDGHQVSDKHPPKGGLRVEVFFEQAAYYDYSYDYCFDDDTIYEGSFYVGD